MVHNTVFEGKGSQIKALCKLKAKYSQITVVVPVGESDGGPGTAGLTFSEVTSFHSKGLHQEARRTLHWQNGHSSSQK